MLPGSRAAGARVLLCPANLAPLAYPRNVVVIHDAAALRHPEWYSPRLRRLAAAAAAGPGPSRAARRDRIRVLARRAGRAARARRRARQRRRRAASTRVHARTPTPRPRAPRSALERPYVLCVASADRAQEPRGARPGRPRSRRRHRARRRRRPPPAVRARARPRRAAALGHVPDDAAARALRRRRGVRAAVALRGLRPARARGDGVPGRRSSPRTPRAAGDCGGAARLVAADGGAFAAVADGGARRAAARLARRASSGRRAAWDATARAQSTCGPRPLPRGRRRAQRASRRAARRNTRAPARRRALAAAQAAQPRPVERFAPPSRESHVYQNTRWILALARRASSVSAAAQPGCLALLAGHEPGGPRTLPCAAGHDSSVSQTGRAVVEAAHLAPRERTSRSTLAGVRVYGCSATASKAPRPPAL